MLNQQLLAWLYKTGFDILNTSTCPLLIIPFINLKLKAGIEIKIGISTIRGSQVEALNEVKIKGKETTANKTQPTKVNKLKILKSKQVKMNPLKPSWKLKKKSII